MTSSSELHKNAGGGGRARRGKPAPRSAKNPVVEVLEDHDRVDGGWSVTYQRELVLCGKARCRKWHGPYWYAYWTWGRRTRSIYIGKERRPAQEVLNELRKRRAERLSQKPPQKRRSKTARK